MDYAAAEITLLDRDFNVTVAYTYPVTRVILRERSDPQKSRTFTVNKKGEWIEQHERKDV